MSSADSYDDALLAKRWKKTPLADTQQLEWTAMSPRIRHAVDRSIQSKDLTEQPKSRKQQKAMSLEMTNGLVVNPDFFSAEFSDVDHEKESNRREGGILMSLAQTVVEKPRTSPKMIMWSALTDRNRASVSHSQCYPNSHVSGGDKDFLKSLSAVIPYDYQRRPDTEIYIKQFRSTRQDLVQRLYALFNRTVFDSRLPTDFHVIWNGRLTKTAGKCLSTTDPNGNNPVRVARIELSDKVCDSAERVRDTLLHELCHFAAWLINGVRDGHDGVWQLWANRAERKFPDLPPLQSCHSYQINGKFAYRCQSCRVVIKRHSKSLDLERRICAKCDGRFELVTE